MPIEIRELIVDSQPPPETVPQPAPPAGPTGTTPGELARVHARLLRSTWVRADRLRAD